MSGIVVQKYGGTSLATADRIRQVARRIVDTRRRGKQVCVVVSAMGRTTDELMARASEISSSPPRRELDMLLTCGERASMALLSMAVAELGIPSISLTGSQSGIMTNDRHSGARIVEVRPFRVHDELERGHVVIVAGFQGVSYKREITTLGRGGSDTTAVALAAALGADMCEICSDVDGVYSADPRVVTGAQFIEALSHDEMLELSSRGAQVLHAEALMFARTANIAVYCRDARSTTGGTRIDREGGERSACAVTRFKRLPAVRYLTPSADFVLNILGDAAVPIVAIATGEQRSTLWCNDADVPNWSDVCRRLTDEIDGCIVDNETCCVSLVGAGVAGSPQALASARRCAQLASVDIEMWQLSPLAITGYGRAVDADALVGALHRVFCE